MVGNEKEILSLQSSSLKSQSRLLLSPEDCRVSFYPNDKNQCEVLKTER